MVVETKTYEAEPCQNLRLGNGQDLWGGYRLGGALLPHGGGDGDLGPLWSKPYGWETDKTLSVEIKTEGTDRVGHYYHMAVESSKTFEAEPCQNLRLGNGQGPIEIKA